MAKKNEVATVENEASTEVKTGEIMEVIPPLPSKDGRQHRASYGRDSKTGAFNIWVEGPSANKFAGKYVPVTRLDGSESMEKCVKLQWSGKSQLNEANAAVYSFVKHPRAKNAADDVAF